MLYNTYYYVICITLKILEAYIIPAIFKSYI